jgi:hypothetical protein
MGKSYGKRQIERQWHRWAYNIKIDLTELGSGGIVWPELVQDRD